MTKKPKYKMERVICTVCGKNCAASLKGGKGDWTEGYPRRHSVGLVLCEGVFSVAEFISS